jgi:quercetin dioxygenase-like cupin family protein
MSQTEYLVKQLTNQLQIPESGKQSIVLLDDAKTKILLFAFAAGAGLSEHVAPYPAVIQIIQGEASLTVADEAVEGKPGSWIHMAAKVRHSIMAKSAVIMLLTLLK